MAVLPSVNNRYGWSSNWINEVSFSSDTLPVAAHGDIHLTLWLPLRSGFFLDNIGWTHKPQSQKLLPSCLQSSSRRSAVKILWRRWTGQYCPHWAPTTKTLLEKNTEKKNLWWCQMYDLDPSTWTDFCSLKVWVFFPARGLGYAEIYMPLFLVMTHGRHFQDGRPGPECNLWPGTHKAFWFWCVFG